MRLAQYTILYKTYGSNDLSGVKIHTSYLHKLTYVLKNVLKVRGWYNLSLDTNYRGFRVKFHPSTVYTRVTVHTDTYIYRIKSKYLVKDTDLPY